MQRITPQQAALRKFKREYYLTECIFNGMPYPDDNDVTIKETATNTFHCSCKGKNGTYTETIKVNPALDCWLLNI